MIRLNLLVIGLVSILALTGCKTDEKSTTAVDNMGKAATDVAGGIKDKADSAGKAATDAAGGIKDKADSAGKAATDAAGGMKDKADSAGKAATDVAGGMKDKADSAGKAVTDAAGGIKDKADSAGKAATDAAGGIKDKADSAGKAVTDAAGGMKDKADSAGKAVTDAAGGMKDKVAAVSGLTSLSGVVSDTKTAVEAGNFGKAKTEIAKFDGSWAKIEPDIRSKSPAAYGAIETNIKNAKSAIASANKPKAIEALKAVGTAITTATKS